MKFLVQQIFSSLKKLCVVLGNTTLTRLGISGNKTYQSEQSMQEIPQAISSCFEEENLRKVHGSDLIHSFNSII